jgi:phytoene desaturase
MSHVPRAVVVGAGLGGLAVAVRLLRQGWDVTVVERRDQAGGRAGQIRDGGYTWDSGPSLITMPWLLDELFEVGGTRLADELTLRPLDPFYRIFWDGEARHFDFQAGREGMTAEIAKFSPSDAARYDDFMAASGRIYERGILVAGRKPFLSALEFARLVPTMVRLNAVRTLRGFCGIYFKEEHVRQAFDFHSLFIGGDPFRAPAIYTALSYLQVAEGVWYAEGGVYSLVTALARLVERGGGTIRTGESVIAIETEGRRVSGVRTDTGERLAADIVVSNADVTLTRDALLSGDGLGEPLPWRLRGMRQTMSCFLLYLGTTRQYPKLRHHTLIVGQDYGGFIGDVIRRRRVSDTICLYIHAPSRTEPSMAVPGGDSLTILLPVPNLRSGDDWTVRGPEVRDRVVSYLERDFGLEGLSGSIAVEHAFTPADFASELWATDGNAFGVEPLLWQSAYFRQPNRDRVVGGLYYVGAGTHPGGGIPGVMLGAQVTAGVIAADRWTGRLPVDGPVADRGG